MNMFYHDDFTLPEQSYTWQVPVATPAWQLCPKCNGAGMVLTNWEGHGEFYTYCTCDVCNGHKIINIYSGKPPLV